MHIIPQLRALEARFPDALAVIGIHSAKFPAEQIGENLRLAIQRNRIEHPVVNDREFLLWRAYGVRAWPTVMLINPEGRVIGKMEGEFDAEPLGDLIEEIVEQFDAAGKINRAPLPMGPAPGPGATLSFAGKLLADTRRGRLIIADTNHHRVLVAELPAPGNGGQRLKVSVREIIGSGAPGLADGSLETACFQQPQGLALDGDPDCLYVADTENHAIRYVNLRTREVATLSGDGRQARPYPREGPALATSLNSPWDLLWRDDILYIAMAGCHQLWTLDLATGELLRFAGTGGENITDGPAGSATLAQPSGLATDGRRLFFADSETSALRYVTFEPEPQVVTLVGTGLFEFGDVDGAGAAVRLQHPLGVDWLDGALYVADSYNNKIKRVAPETRYVDTVSGSGEHGLLDGEPDVARFWEPGGISAGDGCLYVADTNNHAIRRVDPGTGRVETLEVQMNREVVRPASP